MPILRFFSVRVLIALFMLLLRPALYSQTNPPYILNSTNPSLVRLTEMRRNANDSAAAFAGKLLNEAIENKDKWLEAEVTLEKARISYAKNDQQAALQLSLRAEELSTPQNAAFYNAPQFSAYILNAQGKSDDALQKLFRCLETIETANIERLLPSINFTIADIYRESKNSKNALFYAQKGMDIANKNIDSSQLVTGYILLSNIYSNSDFVNEANLDTAIYYYKKLIVPPFVNKWLKPFDSARVFCNMGRLYRMHNNFGLAERYLRTGLEVATRRDFMVLKQVALNEQITLAMNMGSYPLALKIAEGLAKDFPDNQNSLQRVKDITAKLQELYAITGDYQSAYGSLSKLVGINDSLYNLEKQKTILEIEKKYEADAKVLKAINLAQKNENERNLIIGFAIIFIGVIVAAFLVNSYKKRKQAEFLKTLILEVNHRTKNNLQMLSALISGAQPSQADTQSKTDIQKLKSYIKSFGMMYENLNRSSSFDTVNLSEYVGDISTAAAGGNTGSKLQLDLHTTPGIIISTDKAILIGLIVNELITNSIKHAFHGLDQSKISIHLNKESDAKVSLSYSDNGQGVLHGNTTSGSFGVNMIQQLVKQLKGSIVYDAGNAKNVNIYFPAV